MRTVNIQRMSAQCMAIYIQNIPAEQYIYFLVKKTRKLEIVFYNKLSFLIPGHLMVFLFEIHQMNLNKRNKFIMEYNF